jgi:hypothetical protein
MVRVRNHLSVKIQERRRSLGKTDSMIPNVRSSLSIVPFEDKISQREVFHCYTPASISARGSSGFSFCNSRKISFDRSSCTFGTTTCTSTI